MQSTPQFIETISRLAGVSVADAKKIYNYYYKHKIIKSCKHTGQIRVTHGAFLDKDVLLRALKMVE